MSPVLPNINELLEQQSVKKGRGRPKGSKNKPKEPETPVESEEEYSEEESGSEEYESGSGSEEYESDSEYEYEQQQEQENNQEREKLKEQLIALTERNPKVLTQPINNAASEAIDQMSLEEIKARLRIAKREQASKIDSVATKQVISLVNQVSGRFLGVLDELQESTMNDKLLLESVGDYLGTHILDFIPNEVKIAGLYSSHLGSAMFEKRKRAQNLRAQLQALKEDHKQEMSQENVEL